VQLCVVSFIVAVAFVIVYFDSAVNSVGSFFGQAFNR